MTLGISPVAGIQSHHNGLWMPDFCWPWFG